MRLKDGETQVLAGLISDEDRSSGNKVPVIGELPVLSRLFGSQKDDTQRSEIVLSITPRVIRSIQRPDLVAAEFDSGTDANIGGRGLFLGTAEAEIKPAGAGSVNTTSAVPANPVQPSSSPPPANASAPIGNGINNEPKNAVGGPISFNWQGPNQVKVGDQFSAVLRINSQGAVRGLPLLVGFDPSVLQVMNVQEGDFLKQANGQTAFNNRVDPAQGKIFVAAVRQNTTGSDAGVNGAGNVMMVNFKAIKAAPAAKVQLLSITPEPAASNPIAVPVDFTFKVQ